MERESPAILDIAIVFGLIGFHAKPQIEIVSDLIDGSLCSMYMFLNFFSIFSFSSLRGNYLSLWLGSSVIRAETFPPEIITVFDLDNFQF